MRYSMATILLMLFVLSAVPSFGYNGGGVDLRVVSDSGSDFLTLPFKDFEKKGTHIIKKYLEAKKGENYNIFIDNRTSDRIGVVIAVDGRNIINGKRSDLKKKERMYIISPYGSARLEGWRTGRDTVNRFYFTDEDDSYTKKTFGDTSATGVIAAAVFREKERDRYNYREKKMRESGAMSRFAPGADDALEKDENEEAATGFGNERYSPTAKVYFDPESRPFEKILVKYEWREMLCSKGILRCGKCEPKRLWDNEGYAPYPPEYDSLGS